MEIQFGKYYGVTRRLIQIQAVCIWNTVVLGGLRVKKSNCHIEHLGLSLLNAYTLRDTELQLKLRH